MRLSGLLARFGPSPFTMAPCSTTRSGRRHSAWTPMSRFAALTMRERSVVSRIVEPSSDSRENGTRNCPTVPPHAPCVSLIQRSVAERVSGEVAGVGAAPLVRISTCARYDAHGVMLPSTANRARREAGTATPRAAARGGQHLGTEHALHRADAVQAGTVAPADFAAGRPDRARAVDRLEEAQVARPHQERPVPIEPQLVMRLQMDAERRTAGRRHGGRLESRLSGQY